MNECFIQDLIAFNWERFQLIHWLMMHGTFYSEVTHVIDKHEPMKTIRVKGKHYPGSVHILSGFSNKGIYHLPKESTYWESYIYCM